MDALPLVLAELSERLRPAFEAVLFGNAPFSEIAEKHDQVHMLIRPAQPRVCSACLWL